MTNWTMDLQLVIYTMISIIWVVMAMLGDRHDQQGLASGIVLENMFDETDLESEISPWSMGGDAWG